jgi:hypothetical protein
VFLSTFLYQLSSSLILHFSAIMAYVSYLCSLKVINSIDRRERHKTVRKQKRKVTFLLMLATISFFSGHACIFDWFYYYFIFNEINILFSLCLFRELKVGKMITCLELTADVVFHVFQKLSKAS